MNWKIAVWKSWLPLLHFCWEAFVGVALFLLIYSALTRELGMSQMTAAAATFTGLCYMAFQRMLKLRDHHADFFNRKLDDFREEWRKDRTE